MKKNIFMTIQQCVLRFGIGLMMFSGASVMMAQDIDDEESSEYTENEDSIALAKRRAAKKKAEPTYEMKTVSGTVVDAATKQPVDGARVQAYNNNRYSVMTNENGQYSIQVPVFVTSLYVAVPGYNDVQVPTLEGNAPTAYLYSSRLNGQYKPTTGITSERTAIIDLSSSISVDGEIESQLAGDIHTINRSGIKGQGAAMFIRGLNSLNANAQPLVVLDGMFMDTQTDRNSIHDGFFNNILAGIDPEDIESVQVLKNATALYGTRGANGVVLINTKRGKSMATRINVSVYGGFETAPSTTKMMNGNQYKNYVSELIGTTEYGLEHSTAGYSIPFLNDNPDYYWYPMYHNNTDWSEDLYRSAFTHNYKVNVQGGDDVAMYNLSLGYSNAQSTAKENGFDRLNIRFNTDIKLVKNVSTQLDVAYSRMSYNLRDNGWAEDYSSSTITSPNVLGLIQSPFLSKYGYYTGEDGKLHQSSVYAGKTIDENYPFGFASAYGTNTALANPYWILDNGDGDNKNTQEVTQFNLNVMPKWEISKNWTLTNRFAYQLNRHNEKSYLPKAGTPEYALEGLGDVISRTRSLFGKETSLYEDLRITWKKRFGAHDFNVFGGFRFTSNSFSDNYTTKYNSGNDKMPESGNEFRSLNGSDDEWRNIAYYLNGNYNYMEKYYVEATMTAETSSRFGLETDGGMKLFGVNWGLFPSIQAGWVITNEPWMKTNEMVNYLKLSAGYDISGNDNIGYSLSRTYFQAIPFMYNAIALRLVNIENPKIQWETTRRWNIGLEGSFFKDRVQLGAEVYFSNTSNLLTMKSLNYMAGLGEYWTNDGKLRNSGIDVHANVVLLNLKDFSWQIGASMGHYKNKIVDLPEDNYTTKIYGGEILTSKDNPAGLFYGYKTAGVFANDHEASTAHNGNEYLKYPTGIELRPYTNFRAGDVHFLDQDGNGIINDNDKTVIGDPNPDIYGSVYTNFTYKKWSLDFNFKYSVGNDIYNYQRSRLEGVNTFYNQTQAAVNRWTADNQRTDIPRACTTTSDYWVNNERFSDRWIEDGSYFKLKKVRLSYQTPLNLSWIQGITVWAEANNLFTISKYTGSDPEFSCGNGVLYQGIDAGLLPSNRNFNIGVRINL